MQPYSGMGMLKSVAAGALLCLLPFSPREARGAVIVSPSRGQTVYVPAYSHIYTGDRQRPFYLTATLSIRNTDPVGSIVLHSADYYETSGKLLKRYLARPILLRPLASVRYVVDESDKSGGSGASFLVRWSASAPVSAPVVETVMIGTGMQQGISFTSRGQAIRE